MRDRISILISSVAIGIVFAGAALTMVGSDAKARMAPVESISVAYASNPELAQLRNELERLPNASSEAVGKAEASAHRLLKESKLSSPQDYYNASRIFARGTSIESALSAHEMAILCLAMGDSRAKTLAAVTEDQILSRLGKRQRFGTQLAADGKIAPISEGVSDGIRNLLGLPSIITATKLAVEGRLNSRLFSESRPVPTPIAVVAY
jgi:hypothetical protein